MTLSREQLAVLAVDGYFGNVAAGDFDAIIANFQETAVMRVMTEDIRYSGQAEIADHFVDLFRAWVSASFSDFEVIADEAAQKVVVTFRITLTAADGICCTMANCNIFTLRDGLFQDVRIYMTDSGLDGF